MKLLFRDVERSGDPSRELPQLDAQTRAAGGFIAAACHALMHQVGREYARRHHVTLATLQKYLPKSNDPGCSAGFGHGLIMALGPQILRVGPKGALRVCTTLPAHDLTGGQSAPGWPAALSGRGLRSAGTRGTGVARP